MTVTFRSLAWLFFTSVLLLVTPAAEAVANNTIIQWNSALQRTIRKLSIANQISSRYFGLLHLAQYQALVTNSLQAKADQVAVAAYAGHFISSYYFPNEQTNNYDLLIQAQVAGLSQPQLDAARSVALPVAIALINSRVNDTSQQWAQFRFAPNNSVGVYQPATAAQTAALYPQLANTTTFITPLARDWYPQQFAKFNHAVIGTSQYDLEYQAVKFYGDANSTTSRNSYQQDTPYFWADDVNTAAITGHWNNITAFVLPANVSLLDTAELFAKLQLAFYDGNIQGWFIKYTTLFWRPITAIRQGDPYHAAVPSWTPLISTPAHPEFPSTHSVTSGAAAAVLARYFGTDNVTFTIGSEYPNQVLAPRTYTSFSAGAIEIANSRVYGGIHFPSSGPVGLSVGALSGNYVYENFAKVVPAGGAASPAGPAIPLTFSDGSFENVGAPQPADGVIASGPAPVLPTITLASEASSAPSLPSSAGSALTPPAVASGR
ncbi:hypothetical protein WJX74_004007 [Apatococcus lobatus]|uniref:Phosphatidic acid phosphatase type 2/haloperoxidase domain-containing protein n=1 Tax=Apatococcus lobatus TaxID=904363 RepID=A0AAW1QWY1_9CHLO